MTGKGPPQERAAKDLLPALPAALGDYGGDPVLQSAGGTVHRGNRQTAPGSKGAAPARTVGSLARKECGIFPGNGKTVYENCF